MLMKALGVQTTRELEDLCINTIYASLLAGKLSPHTQTFQVTSCTSRDLPPANRDYAGMIATLKDWSNRCDLVLGEIFGRMRDVRACAAATKQADEKYEQDLDAAKQQLLSKKNSGKGKNVSNTANLASQELDLDSDLMQDIEEDNQVASPRRLSSSHVRTSGGGGESPTGRKRKLVLRPRL